MAACARGYCGKAALGYIGAIQPVAPVSMLFLTPAQLDMGSQSA